MAITPRVDAPSVEPRALSRTLASGVLWTTAAKLVGQSASWIATLVVARLLVPADYAIVGMGSWLVGLLALLTELGLGAAVVAKQRTDRDELRALNTVAVLGGLAATAVLVLAAPLVAAFFREPRVTPVVRVLALGFAIASFRVVPLAVLQRDLRFRRLAQFDGLQSLALAALSIALAWRGFGYWTLVAANLASSALGSALALWRVPIGFARPTRARLGSTLRFGGDVVAQRVCWYAYSNADFAVAGRVLGAGLAGSYALAWGLAHVVVDKIAAVVLQVTPAVLARVQDDPVQLRRYFVRLVSILAVVCLPAMIGLALVAPDLVAFALGTRWADAVTPLRILAAYSAVWIVLGLAGQMLLVTGLERFGTRLTLAQLIVLPPAFWLGARLDGVRGLALAWIVVHPVFVVLMVGRVLRAIDLSWRTLAREALLAPVVATAVMALAVEAVLASASGLPLPPLLVIGAAALVGVAAYTATLELGFQQYLASRIATLRELRSRVAAPAA